MRKSRIKLTEVELKLLVTVEEDQNKLFKVLEELAVQVPTWSKLILVVLKVHKLTLDVSYFEDARDFFLSYTKKALRNTDPDVKYLTLSREASDDWKPFVPPTLIGTNLKTKLRKKREI